MLHITCRTAKLEISHENEILACLLKDCCVKGEDSSETNLVTSFHVEKVV